MSDEETVTELPGEQMIAEAPAPTEAPEFPTVPAWSAAKVTIHKSKAEVLTKTVDRAEHDRLCKVFGDANIVIEEVFP